MQLRKWQSEALMLGLLKAKEIDETETPTNRQRVYVVGASVGAGKTTFGTVYGMELARRFGYDFFIVISPNQSVRKGWASNFDIIAGLPLEYGWNGKDNIHRQFMGVSITFGALATQWQELKKYITKKTLVIIDEVHHTSEDSGSWGPDLIRMLCNRAGELECGAVLTLTGTPYRTDKAKISFLPYDADNMLHIDYTYLYGQAVKDGVNRPCKFHFRNGSVSFMHQQKFHSYQIKETPVKQQRNALRTCLNMEGTFAQNLLLAAGQKLRELRQKITHFVPGGLIVAQDINYALEVFHFLKDAGYSVDIAVNRKDVMENFYGKGVTGLDVIDHFRKSDKEFIIAVNMVSEGTDIPRLLVLAWVTTVFTELMFNQIIGRIVRVIRNTDIPFAHVYAANFSTLRMYAQNMVKEVAHFAKTELEGEAGEGGGGGWQPSTLEYIGNAAEGGDLYITEVQPVNVQESKNGVTVQTFTTTEKIELMRKKCSSLVSEYARILKSMGNSQPEIHRAIHRQANQMVQLQRGYTNKKKQNDMSLVELQIKASYLVSLIEQTKSKQEGRRLNHFKRNGKRTTA